MGVEGKVVMVEEKALESEKELGGGGGMRPTKRIELKKRLWRPRRL